MSLLPNFINGDFVAPATGGSIDVISPSTGLKIAQVPKSTAADVDMAVKAAREAFPAWSGMTIKARAAIMFKFHSLVDAHSAELAGIIVRENGKNLAEALADVAKGNETVEWSTSLPQLATGRQLEVSRGVMCQETREALGVVAAIVPFNFPAMVPMWTIPISLTMGNCVILKPSEKVPLTMQRMLELMVTAGIPPGVFQIVHGAAEVVTAMCDHPDINAVSFVGSSKVAEIVTKRCQAVNKRVLALGGAKNHLLALPDCDVAMTARDVVASFAGCAGQRCMAGSVLILIGDGSEETKTSFMDTLVKEIVTIASKLVSGTKMGQMGPLIEKVAQDRVLEYINEAEANGCSILLDGRSWSSEHTAGFWVGPTIILHSNVEDRAMKEEIFGPVLSIYVASSWDEAISIENNNPYGNAACIYTEKGANAEWFLQRLRATMLGINDAFAGAREPNTSGGVRGTLSHFGGGDLCGEGAIDFFSQKVRTVSRWAPVVASGSSSKEALALRPLTVPTRSSALSPPNSAGKKQLLLNPRSPEFSLLRNSSREGMFRRESSGTTREPMSRDNSGLSDFTECDNSEMEGSAHSGHSSQSGPPSAPNAPKSGRFHGIAATSPFASSDPQFDFDLEKLQRREDSFQPVYSTQPSFEVDPHSALGPGSFQRIESKDWSIASGHSQEEVRNHLTSKRHYGVDLYSVEALLPAQVKFVDAIVVEIGPQDTLLKQQNSAVRFVKKLLRKALQCNIFETGLHGIRCFLPSDSFNLSVVLSGKLEPCWHTLARDGLLKAQAPHSPHEHDAHSNETNHIIKRVECVKVGSELKVTCQCDATNFEITLNSRNEVCILAFFEEVDVLVGCDNLFKRSLMLVRAWWHHETLEAIDASTRALLNDTSICLMVCAIFNQFHARITSPLQALCLFLAEYSAYDGATHAITLQGIVPFLSSEGSQLQHIVPNKKHLLSPALLEKYVQLFNLADVSTHHPKSPTNHGGIPAVPVLTSPPEAAVPVAFVREAFNVLHPFLPLNVVVTGTAEDRKLNKLPKAFSAGAQCLSLALSKTSLAQSPKNGSSGSGKDMSGAFMNILKARFGEVSLASMIAELESQEVLSTTPPYGSPDVAVSVDKHWQNIMYCNFVIKSVVSESAILTFCIDVLSMIGLMTADDLGKRLNEASKVPQLMVALKEQVGGLKEFLKRFPDVFVFSFEHPYNPHIFLRIVLSPELQAEVENGVLPVKFLSQIIAKFGRIAPPPPKADSPSLRRKVLAPTLSAAPVSHSNSVLDEKVVFGHERSAGGANTLRLMQADIDLTNVVGSESVAPIRPINDAQSLQIGVVPSNTAPFHNPYAAPFVPGQALPPSRKAQQILPPAIGQQPSSLHGNTSLAGPTPPSYFQQDLNLMSNSVLNSGVSLSKGSNGSSNSSLAGGSSRLLYDMDFQDNLLDGSADYFGDTLSLNGEPRSATHDLLSSLRENSKELQSDLLEEYPPAINISLNPGLGGNSSRSVPTYAANNRSRFQPAAQGLDGFTGDFDFEAPGNGAHDIYHQAAAVPKPRAYGSQQAQHLGQEDYNAPGPGADVGYIPNTYGGYHGAADYQQQHQPYGQGGPAAYGPGPRGMVRTNSRPLMLNPQQQQQQVPLQQPKYQHKRYDVAQQFKK